MSATKFSTKRLFDTINESFKEFDHPNSKAKKEYLEGIKAQKECELELLTAYQACPQGIDSSDVLKYLTTIDFKAIKSETSSHFYSSSMMIATACIASGMIIDDKSSITHHEKIRKFLSDLRIFGTPSASGYALQANLTPEAKDLFVVKAPRDPNDNDELIHECVVAFYALNKLRERGIPNFAYVYGAFMCSPPFVDTSDPSKAKIVTFCNSGEAPVSYAIYENIAPSVSFDKYIETCTAKEFLDMYLQIIVALYAARNVKFVHYDLHTNNVLIRKINEDSRPVVIGIDVDAPATSGTRLPFVARFRRSSAGDSSRTFYFTTPSLIPTMIDYGMSHVEIQCPHSDVRNFGLASETNLLVEYGIRRDKYNPLHDPYKLLCYGLAKMYGNRESRDAFGALVPNVEMIKKYETLKGLLAYFTDDNPAIVLTQQLRTHYCIPWMDELETVDLLHFIEWVEEYYRSHSWDCPMSRNPPEDKALPVLRCGGAGASCLSTFAEFDKLVGIFENVPPIPSGFFELRITLEQTITQHEQLLKRVPTASFTGELELEFERLLNGFIPKIDEAILTELRTLETHLQIISTGMQNPLNIRSYKDLLTRNALYILKRITSWIAKYFDAYQTIEATVMSLAYVREFYAIKDTKEYKEALAKINEPLTVLLDRLIEEKEFREKLKNFCMGIVKIFIPTKRTKEYVEFIRYIRDHHHYKWYIISFPSIITVVNVESDVDALAKAHEKYRVPADERPSPRPVTPEKDPEDPVTEN